MNKRDNELGFTGGFIAWMVVCGIVTLGSLGLMGWLAVAAIQWLNRH